MFTFEWPWTEGRFGGVNLAGIKFYNNLINSLLRKGGPSLMQCDQLPPQICHPAKQANLQFSLTNLEPGTQYTWSMNTAICDHQPFRHTQGTRRKIWLLAEPWNAVSTYSFSFEVSTRILYRSVAARRCSKHIYGCFCISLQGGLHLLRQPLLQDVWWPSKALDYFQWAKSYGEARILQWKIPTQSLFQAIWEMHFWEFINWALHCST